MVKLDINTDRSENVKYDFADYAFYVRNGILSSYQNFTAECHWHEDIELIAVLSGHMLYNVNGEIVCINEGEGILVNSQQLHFGFSDDMTECEFICILFHPLVLYQSDVFYEKYVLPMLQSNVHYILLSQDSSWKSETVRYMCDIYDHRYDTTAPIAIQGYAYLLWNKIIAHTGVTTNEKSVNKTKLAILKNMISFIYKHYTEKISLENIANAGYISKRSCGTIFVQYLNKTPIEFLTDYRLRKSIELMENTDMTVLEISLAVGFSSSSYYAETFHKYIGASPSEYRKSIKKWQRLSRR